MSDRNLTMKLSVDAKQILEAAKAQKQLAAETRNVAKAQKELTEEQKKTAAIRQRDRQSMQTAAAQGRQNANIQGPVDVESAAYERVNKARMQRDIEKRARQIDPSLGPQRKGMGIPGPIKSLIGAGAAGHILGSASQYARQQAASGQAMSVSGALGGALRDLPLIGGGVDLIQQASGGASLDASARNVQSIRERAAMQEQISQARSQGQQQISDAKHSAALAQIGARGAARSQQLVAGGNAAQFVTEAVAGVSTEETGSVRLAAEQAKIAAQTAKEQAEADQQRLKVLQAEKQAAAEATRTSGGRLANQSAATAKAQRRYDESYGFQGNAFEVGQRATDFADAQENQAQAQADYEAKISNELEKQKQLTEATKQAQESKLAAIKAEEAAARANVAILQDQLNIKKQQLDLAKQGAQSLSRLDAAGQESLVDIAKRFKQGGLDAVSLDERETLRGYGPARQLVEDAEQKAGSQSAAAGQLDQILGVQGASNLDAIKAEVQSIQQELIRQNAEIAAKFQQDTANAMSEFAKTITTMLTEILRLTEEQIRAKFAGDQNAQRVTAGRQ